MDFFCQSKFVVDDARKTKDLIVKLKGYLDSLLSTCTSLQMQVGSQATTLIYRD
jgi:hypothetical protein